MEKRKILIVDDSAINRSLLSGMLDDTYDILEAGDGIEAIAQIKKHKDKLALVLLDIVMPKMDGFEVLSVMHKNKWTEDIPAIIISAETAGSYINHAYDLGVAEYISRPFDEKTIKRRVTNIIMLYTKQKILENLVIDKMLEKEKSDMMMVEILSHIVEFRNGESGLHVLHIRTMTEIILRRLAQLTNQYDLSLSKISLIANASALHDIGKISIPEEILNKPGKLTADEFEVIKTHSAIGAEMIAKVSYYQNEELAQIAHDICRWHHERYDGKGYPDGLVGEQIPIAAQVVALADVYDALTNQRVYKPAFSHEKAMEMIFNGECGKFNPLLLECLEYCAQELKEELMIHSAGHVSREEIKKMTRNMVQNGETPVRKFNSFDQVMVKHQFYSQFSRELEFEYECASDLLSTLPWAADYLSLDSIIINPRENARIRELFSEEVYDEIKVLVSSATPEAPVVTMEITLSLNGQVEPYTLILRPLWENTEETMITGVIGKAVPAV